MDTGQSLWESYQTYFPMRQLQNTKNQSSGMVRDRSAGPLTADMTCWPHTTLRTLTCRSVDQPLWQTRSGSDDTAIYRPGSDPTAWQRDKPTVSERASQPWYHLTGG